MIIKSLFSRILVNSGLLLSLSLPLHSAPVPNKWLFAGTDDAHNMELWVTDGTAVGTKLLIDMRPGRYAASYPCCLVQLQAGKFLFAAAAPNLATEPWVTDGTLKGTKRVLNFLPVGYSYYSSSFTPRYTPLGNGKALLTLYTKTGVEPWVTDGTPKGTLLLKDINFSQEGSTWSSPESYTLLTKGTAVFAATDPLNGRELWKTNGTPKGTVLIKNIVPDINSSDPNHLTSLGNGKVVFTAKTPQYGTEPWVTDGTKVGTKLLKDTRTGSETNYIFSMVQLRTGKALFGSNGGLWLTDGTPKGTQLLRNKTDFSFVTVKPVNLGNGKILFANAGIYAPELWVTDGTIKGTQSLKVTFDFGLPNRFLVPIGKGKAIFSRSDKTHGAELWVTDGTVAGTKMVKDIYPGKTNSTPREKSIRSLGNGMAIFSADDPFNALQLYITDGTKAGTIPLKKYNSTLYKAYERSSSEFWPIAYGK